MARSRDSRRHMTARPMHYRHIVSILFPFLSFTCFLLVRLTQYRVAWDEATQGEIYKREGERTGLYCPNAVPRPSGLGVDRRGSRRVRRLRRDLPGGRRFGTFAGTAAAAAVVVVVVAVGAAVVVARGCSIPASQAPCPAATWAAATWAAAGTCSQYAAALSPHRTLASPASLGQWSAFRAIASDSLRRQGLGLQGKNSCQSSLCEVPIVNCNTGGCE